MSTVAFSPMQLALHVEQSNEYALKGWHNGEIAMQKSVVGFHEKHLS